MSRAVCLALPAGGIGPGSQNTNNTSGEAPALGRSEGYDHRNMQMKPYVVTPAAGKRLIARAMAVHPAVETALTSGTVVIVAGTTNGYVAEEILARVGGDTGFSRRRFFRGITLPPSGATAPSARPASSVFPGDVVLVRGSWQEGKTIFDVVDDLNEGDVILKGANALDLCRRQAAVLIGDPKGGTAAAAMQAVVGRRTRLILPVGLEKRVCFDVYELAARMNAPGASGPRLLPVIGEIVTEIEAIGLLSGASAELVAGGGVGGAEGAVWLAVDGTVEQMQVIDDVLRSVGTEPAFEL